MDAEKLKARAEKVYEMFPHAEVRRATNMPLLWAAYLLLLGNDRPSPTEKERLAARTKLMSVLGSPEYYGLDKPENMRIVELLLDHYRVWPKL